MDWNKINSVGILTTFNLDINAKASCLNTFVCKQVQLAAAAPPAARTQPPRALPSRAPPRPRCRGGSALGLVFDLMEGGHDMKCMEIHLEVSKQ